MHCRPIQTLEDWGYFTSIASVLSVKVLISFVATAGLTLLLSVFALSIDALGRRSDRNGTDSIFADKLKRQFWRKIVERVVLGLSDQQLVTGTAILSVGLYRVPPSRGHISFYHFSLLTDLAWFSSNTHQLAVMVLREYFRDHPALRIWRGLGMLVMGLLLLVVAGFTSVVPQTDSYTCPAQCVIENFNYSGSLRGRPLAFMLINIIFLIWGYSIALIPLFDVTRDLWKHVKDWSTQRPYGARRPGEDFRRFAGVMIYFFGSERFKIVFSTFFFGLGLYELFADRAYGEQQLAADQSEDEMSFGQILPLALMALPILSAFEIYYGTFYRSIALYLGVNSIM